MSISGHSRLVPVAAVLLGIAVVYYSLKGQSGPNEVSAVSGTYLVSDKAWSSTLRQQGFSRSKGRLELATNNDAFLTDFPLIWRFGFGPIHRTFTCRAKWHPEWSGTVITSVLVTMDSKECQLRDAVTIVGSRTQTLRLSVGQNNKERVLSVLVHPDLALVELIRQ